MHLLTVSRLATGIRFRRPGTDQCFESFDLGSAEVSSNHRPLCLGNKLVREAASTECGSVFFAGKGHVYGQ